MLKPGSLDSKQLDSFWTDGRSSKTKTSLVDESTRRDSRHTWKMIKGDRGCLLGTLRDMRACGVLVIAIPRTYILHHPWLCRKEPSSPKPKPLNPDALKAAQTTSKTSMESRIGIKSRGLHPHNLEFHAGLGLKHRLLYRTPLWGLVLQCI